MGLKLQAAEPAYDSIEEKFFEFFTQEAVEGRMPDIGIVFFEGVQEVGDGFFGKVEDFASEELGKIFCFESRIFALEVEGKLPILTAEKQRRIGEVDRRGQDCFFGVLEEEVVLPAGSMVPDEPGEQDPLKELVFFDDGEGTEVLDHFHDAFDAIGFNWFFQGFNRIATFCNRKGLLAGHSRYFCKEGKGLVGIKNHAVEYRFNRTYLGDARTEVYVFRSLQDGFCGGDKDKPVFFIADFHFPGSLYNISEGPVAVPVDFKFGWGLPLNILIIERRYCC